MINVGCINPTKVAGTRLSLYSINLEMVPDTYGPTIKSLTPKVTRQQRRGVREARPVAVEGPGRGSRQLRVQAGRSDAGRRRGTVVESGLQQAGGALVACGHQDRLVRPHDLRQSNATAGFDLRWRETGRHRVRGEPLPATATGPDPYNRLGELQARPTCSSTSGMSGSCQVDQGPGLLPREGDLRALTRAHRWALPAGDRVWGTDALAAVRPCLTRIRCRSWWRASSRCRRRARASS